MPMIPPNTTKCFSNQYFLNLVVFCKRINIFMSFFINLDLDGSFCISICQMVSKMLCLARTSIDKFWMISTNSLKNWVYIHSQASHIYTYNRFSTFTMLSITSCFDVTWWPKQGQLNILQKQSHYKHVYDTTWRCIQRIFSLETKNWNGLFYMVTNHDEDKFQKHFWTPKYSRVHRVDDECFENVISFNGYSFREFQKSL